MESLTRSSFSSKIQLLLDSEVEFPQKLKQHLVFKSDQVSNPFKFIGGLLSKGVLSDGSNDSEANFGLKEMMVGLAMMIACTKGAAGIVSLMETLVESGKARLISDFKDWIKQDFRTEIESNLRFSSKLEECGSSVQTKESEILAAKAKKVNEPSSCGAKLVDKIMSRVDDDLMEQLEGHFIGRAYEIVNATEFCSTLVNLKVLDEYHIQLATGTQVHGGSNTEKFVRAVCSKRALGSLVVALESSKNERILAETYDWLETAQVRKKNYPISVKSLANQKRPAATGIFAATSEGLIFLDLQTLEVTSLTSRRTYTVAVAVNHNLKKVYWSEGAGNSRIMRSNFDGSAKEIIVSPTGDWIYTLAIEESSGSVYFALHYSDEIKVCNALGQNCAVVISNSALVINPVSIVVDSKNGFMYWGNCGYFSHSVIHADLDGCNSTKISTGFNYLCGITLDRPSRRVLYYVDWGAHTVGTIDVNAGKQQTLVELERNSALWGIQVDDEKIYFSTGSGGNQTILSVDRNSGKELTTIFKTTGAVWQLALFNA